MIGELQTVDSQAEERHSPRAAQVEPSPIPDSGGALSPSEAQKLARALAGLPTDRRAVIVRMLLPRLRGLYFRLFLHVAGAVVALALPRHKRGIAVRRLAAAGVARAYRTQFLSLASIDAADARPLVRTIQRDFNQIARIEVAQAVAVLWAIIVPMIVAAVAAPVLTGLTFRGSLPAGRIFVTALLTVPLVAALGSLVLALTGRAAFLPPVAEKAVSGTMVAALTGMAVRLQSLVMQTPSGRTAHLVEISLWSGTISLFLLVAVSTAAIFYAGERARRRQPVAALVVTLVTLMASLERHPRFWPNSAFRQRCLRSLEAVAQRVGRDVPRSLSSGDPLRDLWAKTAYSEMAEAIREMKTWLLVPKADTRAVLLARLADVLVRTARGDWDGLERRAEDREARQRLWWVPLWNGVKALTVATLLTGTVFGLIRLGVSIPVAAAGAGPLYFLAWLLKQLDSKPLEALEVVKSIKMILTPGIGKDN